MYLRNLFLASAVVAASIGGAYGATADDGPVDIRTAMGGKGQQEQDVKSHLAGSRALVRTVAEADTARRGEVVPAMVSTVQEVTRTPACRLPGSPARSSLPYCTPASTTLPASSGQPVMVW